MTNYFELILVASDKSLLHNDAKRLFQGGDTENEKDADWSSKYEVKYRSRQQASRHSDRDGTAFASIALPAHYSAIRAVLSHVKHRLRPDWIVSKVIDWGAATGSGLWLVPGWPFLLFCLSYLLSQGICPHLPTRCRRFTRYGRHEDI